MYSTPLTALMYCTVFADSSDSFGPIYCRNLMKEGVTGGPVCYFHREIEFFGLSSRDSHPGTSNVGYDSIELKDTQAAA